MNDFQERESRSRCKKGYFFNFGMKQQQVLSSNSPRRLLQHQQLKAKHKTQGQQDFTSLKESSCQTNQIDNQLEDASNLCQYNQSEASHTTGTMVSEGRSPKSFISKYPSSFGTKLSSPSLTQKIPASISSQKDLLIRVPKKMVYYQNKQAAIQNLSETFAYSAKSQNEPSKNALNSLKTTKINLLSDAFNEFFSTAPSKLYSNQEHTAKQTPQSATKIISVHIDQFPRKNTSLSPKSHKELHTSSTKYHPFVLNEYHRPSLVDDDVHVQVQPMNTSLSLNISSQIPSKLPQTTRLDYPELVTQNKKCHHVDNIALKPRISCESASIPMNIVFPYNMNEDISFPLEQQHYYPQEGEQYPQLQRLVQQQLQHPQNVRKYIVKSQYDRDYPIFYTKQNKQDISQNSQKVLLPFSNTMILTQLKENTDQGQYQYKGTGNENELNNITSREGYQSKQLPKLGSKIKELTEEAAKIVRQEEQKRENHLRKKELKDTRLFHRIGDTQDRIARGSFDEDCNENLNKEEDSNSHRKIEENDKIDLNEKSCGIQTITMVVNNKKKKKEARVVFKLSSSHKLSRSQSPSSGSPLKTQNPEIPCEISNAQESSSHLPFESFLKPLYSPSKQSTRGQVSSPSRQQQLQQQQPPQQQPQEQLQHQNRFEKLVKNQRAIFTKTFSAATQDETPPRNTEQNYYKQQQEQQQTHPSRCSQGVADKKIQIQQYIRYKPAGYFEISPARTVDFQQEAV